MFVAFIYTLHRFLQVPELAGSWLLTILIQFPLIILLLFNEDALLLPLERAVHIVMALFVLFEVICGYYIKNILYKRRGDHPLSHSSQQTRLFNFTQTYYNCSATQYCQCF